MMAASSLATCFNVRSLPLPPPRPSASDGVESVSSFKRPECTIDGRSGRFRSDADQHSRKRPPGSGPGSPCVRSRFPILTISADGGSRAHRGSTNPCGWVMRLATEPKMALALCRSKGQVCHVGDSPRNWPPPPGAKPLQQHAPASQPANICRSMPDRHHHAPFP